jgi:DNA-binding Xre family transcriptional regulator
VSWFCILRENADGLNEALSLDSTPACRVKVIQRYVGIVTDLNIEAQPPLSDLPRCPAMEVGTWAENLRRALPAELTKLREARGLSKNELSARTGLARSFITTLEQGGAAPSVETLGRIAFVLGISPGEILKRAEKAAGPLPRFKKVP